MRRFGDLQAEDVVAIDHRNARDSAVAAVKQTPLGDEVLLHRAVKVEMVASEIGEDRNIIVQSPHSALRQRMRRDFHHRLARAAAHSLGKKLQQIARLGRGVRRRPDFVRNMIFNRPHEHGLATDMVQHRIEQKRGRRLSVGAGHAAQRKLVFGIAEEVRCKSSQSLAPVCNLDQRDSRKVACSRVKSRRRVGDDGDRSLLSPQQRCNDCHPSSRLASPQTANPP